MRLGLALAGAIAAFAAVAPASQANFTTTQVSGRSNVTGRGASFANTAHVGWKIGFENNCSADVGIFPDVTYEPPGSGAGRRAMGERTGTERRRQPEPQPGLRVRHDGRGAHARPPSSQMNQGTDNVGDEGTIHVIPGAVGSVVLAVNFPDNCDRSLLPDSAETNPASANAAPFIDRVRFTRTQSEADLEGRRRPRPVDGDLPDAGRRTRTAPTFITRVVRFDDSGTTFAFKDYLNKVNPAQDWDPGFTRPTPPRARGSGRTHPSPPRPDCAGTPQGPQGTHLTSGCANGNGPLVQKLSTTDGGIGYSDIATARARPRTRSRSRPAAARDDDLFWTQATNPSSTFIEPTDDPNGFRTDGAKGANCDQATFIERPGLDARRLVADRATDSPTG